jgi:subtilisin family serine protease
MEQAIMTVYDDNLRLIGLDALMAETQGRPEIAVGMIDGPVQTDHPSLANATVRSLAPAVACVSRGPACDHGTFIAGILVASRSSPTPGICPACTLALRPVFGDSAPIGDGPSTSADDVAAAIAACVDGGATLINLSLAVRRASERGRRQLEASLDHAARREVIVVAAAGNEGSVASSAITSHPWVVPVVAYDRRGALQPYSNLARSIGQRGVGGPGDRIPGLGADGEHVAEGGTSAAAAFVTGALALLWSLFPRASGSTLRSALGPSKPALVPRLLDTRAAWRRLASSAARPGGIHHGTANHR